MSRDFILNLSEICERMAAITFDGLTLTPQDSVPTPLWERDRRAIEAELGTDLSQTWMYNAVTVYLLEAGYELNAIASLMKSESQQASIYPLVRAIVERTGVVNWILSEDATHRQRALRSSISYLVSINPYVKALNALKVEQEHQAEFRKQQELIETLMTQWFGEPTKPDDPKTSEPTSDRTQWEYEGESYPGFNKLCKLSLERSNLTKSLASAMYDVLSGFTHPNLFFGREHLLAAEGRIFLAYGESDIEKITRFALGAYGEGVKRTACYFQEDPDEAITTVDMLSDEVDAISVL
jgi:hypothetical protein